MRRVVKASDVMNLSYMDEKKSKTFLSFLVYEKRENVVGSGCRQIFTLYFELFRKVGVKGIWVDRQIWVRMRTILLKNGCFREPSVKVYYTDKFDDICESERKRVEGEIRSYLKRDDKCSVFVIRDEKDVVISSGKKLMLDFINLMLFENGVKIKQKVIGNINSDILKLYAKALINALGLTDTQLVSKCIDNVGLEKQFEMGVDYVVVSELKNENMLEVINMLGEQVRVVKYRFGEIKKEKIFN